MDGIIYNTTMVPVPVVLDTNVVITALRSQRGASYKLISKIGTAAFDVTLSVALLLEYETVLKRQCDVLNMSEQDIDDFLDYICQVGHPHDIFYLWRPYLPDPEDDMVLELAVRANCPYIVTYNKKDFKDIDTFGITAVTAKEFLTVLEESS